MINYAYLLPLLMASSLYAAQAVETTQHDQLIFQKTGHKVPVAQVKDFASKVKRLVVARESAQLAFNRLPSQAAEEGFILYDRLPSAGTFESPELFERCRTTKNHMELACNCFVEMAETNDATHPSEYLQSKAEIDKTLAEYGLPLEGLSKEQQIIMQTYGPMINFISYDAATHTKCFICDKTGSRCCSICKIVRYCSVICQKKHWITEHKTRCTETLTTQQQDTR